MPTQVTTTADSIWSGLRTGFTSFMDFLPALIGAVLVLAIGWFVAGLLAKVIERVLRAVKLEHAAARSGISEYLQSSTHHEAPVSYIFAQIAKWFVFLIFIQAAANLLHMPQITAIINSIILFIPNLIVSLGILIVGSFLARFVSEIVLASVSKMGVSRPNVFVMITRYGIMGFAIIAAVNQIGIANNLINILVSGLVFSLALATGLAFGLGGQGVASEVTRSWYEGGKSQAGKLRSVSTGTGSTKL
jgi:hypothetical protein